MDYITVVLAIPHFIMRNLGNTLEQILRFKTDVIACRITRRLQ